MQPNSNYKTTVGTNIVSSIYERDETRRKDAGDIWDLSVIRPTQDFRLLSKWKPSKFLRNKEYITGNSMLNYEYIIGDTRPENGWKPTNTARFNNGLREEDTEETGGFDSDFDEYPVKYEFEARVKKSVYPTKQKTIFGTNPSFVPEAPHSDKAAGGASNSWKKVNDIVIHNPTAVENTIVVSLPEERDQRTNNSKYVSAQAKPEEIKCPQTPEECTFRILQCRYTGNTTHTTECKEEYTRDYGQVHKHTEACLSETSTYKGRPIEEWQFINRFNCTGLNNIGSTPGKWEHLAGNGKWEHPATNISHISSTMAICSYCGETEAYITENGDGTWNFNHNTPITHETIMTSYCSECGKTTGYLKTAVVKEQHDTLSAVICTTCNKTEGRLVKSVGQNTAHAHDELCYSKEFVCDGSVNYHRTETSYILNCKEPHHNSGHYNGGTNSCYVACMNDANHNDKKVVPNPSGGDYKAGNFINLDYGFDVHFPLTGNFIGNAGHGLGATSSDRGFGPWDADHAGENFDTNPWTLYKTVQFPFHVIYEGVLYPATTEIVLGVNNNYIDRFEQVTGMTPPKDKDGNIPDTNRTDYHLYCVLGNSEMLNANVVFRSYTINAGLDNNYAITNKERDQNVGQKAAYHSAKKEYPIDVVGRIGAMTIEDTDDWRFSNLFKKQKDTWLVNNLIKNVDVRSQAYIVTDTSQDIRGEDFDNSPTTGDTSSNKGFNHDNHDVNTGLKLAEYKSLPLSAALNPIKALENQEMLMGYDAHLSYKTIGNYYNQSQITPYYYIIDSLDPSAKWIPADIWMDVEREHKQINIYDNVKAGWDTSSIARHFVNLSWAKDAPRRNYLGTLEESNTNKVKTFKSTYMTYNDGTSELKQLQTPEGVYHYYGTSQILDLDGGNRTFTGNTITNGDNKNPGDRIISDDYTLQEQRWHYSLGLPSTGVALPQGTAYSSDSVKKWKDSRYKVASAVRVIVPGEVFTLEYQAPINQTVKINGLNFPYNEIPPSIENPPSNPTLPPKLITIFDGGKDSSYDLDTSGTH